MFAARLAKFGDAPALVTETATLSYAELAQSVSRRASEIGQSGHRELVLLQVRNDLASVIDYLACLAGGHPAILSCPDGRSANNLRQVYSPTLECASGLTTFPEVGAAELHPELALMLSTSGTTGSAKTVRLSYENVQSNAEAIAAALHIRPTDRAITSLPLSYCYGLSVLNSHLASGAAVVLTEHSVSDPKFWDLVADKRVTTFPGVPHTFDLLERVGFAKMHLPNLRYVTQAGGRMPAEQVQRFAELGQQRGFDLVVMYGQTEATARMSTLSPDLAAANPSSVGRPIPGGSFTIDSTVGATSDAPESGELLYSGPNVMLGYAQRRADLALGRTVDVLRTGDIARRTPNGTYEILGRLRRTAKLFGLRVDLDRVEAHLAANGVSAACTTNEQHLLVTFDSRHDPQHVANVAAEFAHLPPYAVCVRAIERLPRTAIGKLDYLAAADAVLTPVKHSTRAKKRDSVQELYGHLLARPEVKQTDSFVGLGGDSLSYVEMTVRLEEIVGELPPDWATQSVQQLQNRRVTVSRSRFAPIETSVALRALAIACVVGTHAGVFTLLGGAHLLLAVAGFTFARFVLARPTRAARLRQTMRGIAYIAVPTVAVGVIANLFTGMYSWTTPFLLNWTTSVDHWTVDRQFWFIEVLIGSLLLSGAILAVPTLDRLVQRHPFAFPMTLVVMGTTWQLMLTALDMLPANRFGTFHFVFWLFALGWAISQTRSNAHRIIVSLAALIGLAGYFDNPARDAFVLAGLALLIWTSKLLVPRILTRPISLIAASSLYIYLIHWQIYSLGSAASPVFSGFSLAVCLGSGIAVWAAVTAVQRALAIRVSTRALRESDGNIHAAAGSRPSLIASMNSR